MKFFGKNALCFKRLSKAHLLREIELTRVMQKPSWLALLSLFERIATKSD